MAKGKVIAKVDERQTQVKRVDSLIARANDGDAQAMKELRPMIHDDPGFFNIFGDLAEGVRQQLVARMTGDGKAMLTKDRLYVRLRKMKADLSGSAPTPLEVLLVERILTCYLEVNWYDFLYTSRRECTLQQGDYYQRRQDRAHKRYLSAVKALAQVRRLELPAVQVNIAGQQMNTQAIITRTAESKKTTSAQHAD